MLLRNTMPNAEFVPDWFSVPGETIVDALSERDLSREAFARAMKEPVAEMDRLLAGERPLTADLAKRLVKVIGGSEQFWLRREAQYRQNVRVRPAETEADAYEWLNELPVRDMVRFRWIEPAVTKRELLERCRAFFNVDSLASWRVQN